MKIQVKALAFSFLMAMLLFTGCGNQTTTAGSSVPDEAAMKQIVTRMMPEVEKIEHIMQSGLDHDSNNILGTARYYDMDMRYAKVTDPAFPTWDAITTYLKANVTDNYMKANYMGEFLSTADDAKKSIETPLYLEFDGQLAVNIELASGGGIHYATETAVFSNVTADSFQASMDSIDIYDSPAKTVVKFQKGTDGNWRVDNVDNQWIDAATSTND